MIVQHILLPFLAIIIQQQRRNRRDSLTAGWASARQRQMQTASILNITKRSRRKTTTTQSTSKKESWKFDILCTDYTENRLKTPCTEIWKKHKHYFNIYKLYIFFAIFPHTFSLSSSFYFIFFLLIFVRLCSAVVRAPCNKTTNNIDGRKIGI